MRDITVLITGSGAPGAPGIIKSLRVSNDRSIRVVGVDMKQDESIGVGLLDKSYEISKANDPNFIQQIMTICKKEKVDGIIPLVTNELFVFAKNKKKLMDNGILVSVSDFDKLQIANNKHLLFEFCKKIDVPTPDFRLVKSLSEFKTAAHELGYPKQKICFKPPISNGLRGFRIINDSTDRMDNLMNEKPNNVFISFNEFIQIASESNYFPELLLMEYLPGDEYSIDALGDGTKCHGVIPRTREKIKMGISFVGTTYLDKDLIRHSKTIIENLGLTGNIGFQFKRDAKGVAKIIESNPRVQGTIVLCTAAGYNMVYNAVKIMLGEEPLPFNVNWGTKMIRYWEERYFTSSKESFSLE